MQVTASLASTAFSIVASSPSAYTLDVELESAATPTASVSPYHGIQTQPWEYGNSTLTTIVSGTRLIRFFTFALPAPNLYDVSLTFGEGTGTLSLSNTQLPSCDECRLDTSNSSDTTLLPWGESVRVVAAKEGAPTQLIARALLYPSATTHTVQFALTAQPAVPSYAVAVGSANTATGTVPANGVHVYYILQATNFAYTFVVHPVTGDPDLFLYTTSTPSNVTCCVGDIASESEGTVDESLSLELPTVARIVYIVIYGFEEDSQYELTIEPSMLPSATPTPTTSPSTTGTPSATPSTTSSVTATRTPTPSATPTQTGTTSPTPSLTQSITATPSASATTSATQTATATVTPTSTSSSSKTATTSATSTASPSTSPTTTETPSVTASTSASVSASGTPSGTTSVTATVSGTASYSGTPSVSGTQTRSG
ncbi:MAG: hypothetical protein EOO65_02930, partial [Methanosarcinales archaeon]